MGFHGFTREHRQEEQAPSEFPIQERFLFRKFSEVGAQNAGDVNRDQRCGTVGQSHSGCHSSCLLRKAGPPLPSLSSLLPIRGNWRGTGCFVQSWLTQVVSSEVGPLLKCPQAELGESYQFLWCRQTKLPKDPYIRGAPKGGAFGSGRNLLVITDGETAVNLCLVKLGREQAILVSLGNGTLSSELC